LDFKENVITLAEVTFQFCRIFTYSCTDKQSNCITNITLLQHFLVTKFYTSSCLPKFLMNKKSMHKLLHKFDSIHSSLLITSRMVHFPLESHLAAISSAKSAQRKRSACNYKISGIASGASGIEMLLKRCRAIL